MSRMYDNPQFIGGKYSTDTSPIDDRFVVQTQADLFLETTWENRGLYKGLFTVVTSDSTPDNNGMYVLKNPNYRDKQSWDLSSAETYSPNGWFRVGAVMDTFLSGVTVMKGTDISDYNTAHNTNYDTTKVYLKFVFTTKPDGMIPVQQDIVVDVSDFYDSTDAFLWVTFSKAAHSNGAMTSNKSYSQIETAINDGKLVIGEYQPNVQGYPKQYFMIPVHINSSTLLFANMSPNTANEVLYISVTSSAVTLDIQKDYAIPDVANNDGKVLTANAMNDSVEWTTLPTQQQADWNQSDTTAADYIKNKPTIPTVRTMNHEQLTDSTRGDINIHDGFYFPNAVQDYDGNWYGAVVIGDQVWLGENLRTTKYADGTPISQETEVVDTAAYFDKTTSNIPLKERGLFYNWYAVMNGEEESDEHPIIQGVAPTGWHVPNINEYIQLRDYIANQERYNHFVDSYLTPRCNLKVISSIDHWKPRTYRPGDSHFGPGIDSNLNNSTGFNAKPCNTNNDGTNVYFWTSTKGLASDRAVYVWGEDRTNVFFTVVNYSTLYNTYFNVRCVSDLNPVQFRNWYIEQYGSLQHHLPEEVQEQADWNQTTTTAPDYIKNKPDLSSFITLNDVPREVFVCNYNTTNNTMDKTPAEILAAYESNKNVICQTASTRFFCQHASQDAIMFSSLKTAISINMGNNSIAGMTTGEIKHIVYSAATNTWAISAVQKLQQQLTNGTNIKTINGTSILGSGNITTTELPAVTSSDNGKILIVDNGAWAASAVPVADNTLF